MSKLPWLTANFLEAFARLHKLQHDYGPSNLEADTESFTPSARIVKSDSRLFRSLEKMKTLARRSPVSFPTDTRSRIITLAATKVADQSMPIETAVEEAARILKVDIGNPVQFAAENAGEISNTVAQIVNVRLAQLRHVLKARVLRSLQEIVNSGGVDRAFLDLLDGLQSEDENRRERAARQLRDLVIKFLPTEPEQQDHTLATPRLRVIFDE